MIRRLWCLLLGHQEAPSLVTPDRTLYRCLRCHVALRRAPTREELT